MAWTAGVNVAMVMRFEIIITWMWPQTRTPFVSRNICTQIIVLFSNVKEVELQHLFRVYRGDRG